MNPLYMMLLKAFDFLLHLFIDKKQKEEDDKTK